MRAVLEARRKAAVVRVEELEAELGRVREDLADAEEALRRRVIGLEQYLEALAEEEVPAVMVGGPSRRKPDAGKRINGRKRHLLTDTLGLLLAVLVTPAGPTIWPVDCAPEPVGEAVTPTGGRTGLRDHDHATPRQQGLLILAGLDIRELPRGPSTMHPHRTTHSNQDPVRSRPPA